MSYPRLYRCAGGTTAFCVFLMMMCVGSGVVWGQKFEDAYEKFMVGYDLEFQELEKKISDYVRFSYELYSRPNGLREMTKQFDDLVNNPQSENARRQLCEAIVDESILLKQMKSDKAREIFPDDLRRKMQTRQFQLAENVMRRLDLLKSVEDIFGANTFVTGGFNLDIMPDFLELTPEQRKLIANLQKESEVERLLLGCQARIDQREKYNEIEAILRQIGNPDMGDEERKELISKIQSLNDEIRSPIAPQIKQLTLKYRESFLRVLTDAQKAKIAAVMADMPDYMKNLFAAIDREGGGLSILHNWQPGMGVPGVNPNREAPRERTNTGGRTFPGN